MHNFVRRWMPLAIVVSLLTACAMANYDPACACPPIREYSRDFQRRLADEIESAPTEAVFPLALQDYAVLRGQVIGCQ